jgi:hypothetical protein
MIQKVSKKESISLRMEAEPAAEDVALDRRRSAAAVAAGNQPSFIREEKKSTPLRIWAKFLG